MVSIEPTTRDNLTVPVSVCAICDAGKDPLDVPGVSCGHSGEQRRTVLVEVVPKAEVQRLRAGNQALEDRVRRAEETRENANRAHMRVQRLFNRLDAAISHHKAATGKQGFTEIWDDALYVARDKVLRDAHERKG